MKQTLQERLRNRSFRLATRDLNGDGAKLAIEAADALDLAEKAINGLMKYGHYTWPECADGITALKAIKGVE